MASTSKAPTAAAVQKSIAAINANIASLAKAVGASTPATTKPVASVPPANNPLQQGLQYVGSQFQYVDADGNILPPSAAPSNADTGTGGGGGSGGSKPFNPGPSSDITKPTTAAQDRADLIAKYGSQVALIDSVPELSNLLNTALSENWSATKWTAEYQNTQWYQQHGAAYITAETDRLSDPGKYAEAYNNLLAQMQRTANTLGIDVSGFGSTITADQAKVMDPSKPNTVSTLLQTYYNTQAPTDFLNQYIAKNGSLALSAAGTAQGTIATNAQSLKSFAASMGVASQYVTPSWTNANGVNVNASKDYFTNAADAIAQGATTLDAEQALYRNTAQAIYKPFATQIAAGQSVFQLAQPYLASASNLLEVDPSTISLGATTGLGAKVTKALQGDGANATTLDTFNTQLKQDPAWLQTTNARNSVMDTANSLLRSFGLVNG